MIELTFGFIYDCAAFFSAYLIPLAAVFVADVAVTILWRVLRD